MRKEEGAWRSGTQGDGNRYYLHRLTTDTWAYHTPAPRPPGPEAPRADADLRHRAYSALLARLTLSKPHAEALRRRGLNDAEIDRRGYRTLPVQGRGRLALDLREEFGEALLSVPGFVRKQGEGGRPYVSIAGAAGVLVPVRDTAGRVAALLVRRDDVSGGRQRYSYLSSAKSGGPGPGAPAHVPLGSAGPAEVVRVTEGALKADVAFALSGLPTIGCAGLSWGPALGLLRELGCRTVRLAFDADATEKPGVARALGACAGAAADAGLAVELERWPAEQKGVDDALAAGAAVEVLVGDDARQALAEIVAEGTAGEALPEPGPLDRLDEVLARGAAALFGDRPLLEALARLAAADRPAFAARRAALKGTVSLRDLDAALKPFLLEQARERPALLMEAADYRVSEGRIVRKRQTPDGPVEVPLCNFTARITEAVVRDDGAERTTYFTLAGALADARELPPVQVPAGEFGGLNWVTSAWHGEAVVYAGQGTRDHLRAAIELLSDTRTRRTVYGHTGWRRIRDAWHYLHAGGAIGADGPAAGVEVALPDPLAGYVLPAPLAPIGPRELPPPGPLGEARRGEAAEAINAIRASLALLLEGPAPDRIAFPCWVRCTGWRWGRPPAPSTCRCTWPARTASARARWRPSPNNTTAPAWTRGTCPAAGRPPRTPWRGWPSPPRTRCWWWTITPRGVRPGTGSGWSATPTASCGRRATGPAGCACAPTAACARRGRRAA
jgi:hypothetical protein